MAPSSDESPASASRRGHLLRAAAAPLARLWEGRPATRRLCGALVVVAVGGLGAVGAAFPILLRRALPAADDWAAAAALLARDARPGDGVAVSPAWAERLRAVVPSRLPVFTYPRYAGQDLDGVRRLWLVSLPGAPGFSWDAEVDLLERAARAEAPLTLGGLEVARLDVTYPDLPLAFLPDRLDGALVAQGSSPCTPGADDGGRRCPSGAEVARTVADVGGLPRPCLAVRGAGPEPLTLAFSSVPMGRVLRGHVSIPADGPGGGAPVRVAARIDGAEAGAASLPAGGWRAFRFDTGRWSGQTHALVLDVRADRPVSLCLEAVTLP